MNKKERYINYVIDNLVKNTEIDYEEEIIHFPFYPPSLFPIHLLPSLIHLFLFSPSSPLPHLFSNHVKEKYGTHDDEVKIIWDMYRSRIKSLIKK